eukprot:219435-Chlamydomonas_euryale.AAC.1
MCIEGCGSSIGSSNCHKTCFLLLRCSSSSSSKPATKPAPLPALLQVLQQQYVEALDAGDAAGALATLRGRMAPLNFQPARLHALAALLMYVPRGGGAAGGGVAAGGGSGEGGGGCEGGGHTAGVSGAERGGNTEVSAAAAALGVCVGTNGREAVLAAMHRLLPPSLMLPPARLEVLLEQALESQVWGVWGRVCVAAGRVGGAAGEPGVGCVGCVCGGESVAAGRVGGWARE